MKMKERDRCGQKNREFLVIPFTPLYEPIPLEDFGPDGNSIFGGGGGGFSDSHLMDEIDNYRSKAAKNGKKKMSEEMESDLCWKDNDNRASSSVQKRTGTGSCVRSSNAAVSHETQIYKKRTLSAGAYDKLIESYMSIIDSTIAAKKVTTNVESYMSIIGKT
ncbi:unnamed protein product [Cochlearia groenlandica]